MRTARLLLPLSRPMETRCQDLRVRCLLPDVTHGLSPHAPCPWQVHSLIQIQDYTGPFLPGFAGVDDADPLAKVTESPKLAFVDHVVGNQPDGAMEEVNLALLPLHLLYRMSRLAASVLMDGLVD